VRLIDQASPESGLRFDGRITEDFKLSTGTWVSVGTLRPMLLSAAEGLLQDAVLGGLDRDYVVALAWLNLAHARRLAGAGAEADARSLARDPSVRAAVFGALERLNRGAGSSQRIARLLIVEELPSLDAGEITDKGYINQRATLERRGIMVERLFAEPPHPDVIAS
jgi:feruloyl-CoA synthase